MDEKPPAEQQDINLRRIEVFVEKIITGGGVSASISFLDRRVAQRLDPKFRGLDSFVSVQKGRSQDISFGGLRGGPQYGSPDYGGFEHGGFMSVVIGQNRQKTGDIIFQFSVMSRTLSARSGVQSIRVTIDRESGLGLARHLQERPNDAVALVDGIQKHLGFTWEDYDSYGAPSEAKIFSTIEIP